MLPYKPLRLTSQSLLSPMVLGCEFLETVRSLVQGYTSKMAVCGEALRNLAHSISHLAVERILLGRYMIYPGSCCNSRYCHSTCRRAPTLHQSVKIPINYTCTCIPRSFAAQSLSSVIRLFRNLLDSVWDCSKKMSLRSRCSAAIMPI